MSQLRRAAILSRIVEADEVSPRKMQIETPEIVSPISSIVRDLSNSSLSPDDGGKRGKDCGGRRLETGHNVGLFKNAFKIRGTPEGPVKSKPKARRLLGMASRRLSSPETVPPSVNKENGAGSNCQPSSFSPQKIIGTKRSNRFPLEDCDPNSQDSGYGASFPEREDKSRDVFQFAEPLGVAPRRQSVESRGSPMQSPVRSSPYRHRTARPSLFRSLSSGYESMDDGFNDLIDLDSLDDTTQLPNGLSSLLSGNIVANEHEPETVLGSSIENVMNDSMENAMSDSMENLIESEATTTPEFPRTKSSGRKIRRSLSLQIDRPEKNATPTLSKVRSCLFRSPNASSSTARLGFPESSRSVLDSSPQSMSLLAAERNYRSFKRPEPPTHASPKLVKRSRKSNSFLDIPEANDMSPMSCNQPRVPLQRSFSETEAHAHIKSAVHRSIVDTDLTGDFSKPCVLPLATGHHEDLKSISAITLAGLIRGEFDETVASFRIVDCRYPYEFDGGHIMGAQNLYTKELIEQTLLEPLKNAPAIPPDTSKRHVLVFHCEFSCERGPNLTRFLRNSDRQRNKEHYPALHYPEVYLLQGGYEEFFREQRDLCSPQGYRPMRHPDHEEDLRQFRSKSKSWQGEKTRLNGLARTNLKRLGF